MTRIYSKMVSRRDDRAFMDKVYVENPGFTRPTTWGRMEKYNLPVTGSHIRVLSHLDTYVSVGSVCRVGWDLNSIDVRVSNVENSSGTYCRDWQFQKCEWEYVYDHVDNPHLKWPRATFVAKERA